MNIDELDIKVLKENYNIDEIKNIDINNVSKINKYLEENGIYFYPILICFYYLVIFLLRNLNC